MQPDSLSTLLPFGKPGVIFLCQPLSPLHLQLMPRVRHAWLVHELNEEALHTAQAAGVQQLCPRANILTAEGVQSAVAAGFTVRAWGIKDLELLQHAVACGAQGATVNWPDDAAALLSGMRSN